MKQTIKHAVLYIILLALVVIVYVVYGYFHGGGLTTAATAMPQQAVPVKSEPSSTIARTDPVVREPQAVPRVVAQKTDVWSEAVANYTRAQKNAFIDRTHSRVTAIKIQALLEAWPWQISPEVKKRLETLLIDRELANVDAEVAARKQGISTAEPQLKMIQQAEMTKIEDEIGQLVGANGLAEVQRRWMIPDLMLYTWEFRGEAYQRDIPITSEQRVEMQKLLSQLDTSVQKPWDTSPIDPSTGLTQYDIIFLEEASTFLTNKQLEVVRGVRQEANLHRAGIQAERATSATVDAKNVK